jgi:hypothetical protein
LTPWLSVCGVYAITRTRGVGEFGREWHLGWGLQQLRSRHAYVDKAPRVRNLVKPHHEFSTPRAASSSSSSGTLPANDITRVAAVCHMADTGLPPPQPSSAWKRAREAKAPARMRGPKPTLRSGAR